MWSKIKYWIALLFLLFSISQGVAQVPGSGCWLSDLTSILKGSPAPTTNFRNFALGNTGFADFQAIRGVAKDRGLSNTELLEFSQDLARISDPNSFISSISDSPELVDSWKVLSIGENSLRSLENIGAVHDFMKANPNVTYTTLRNTFNALVESRRQAFVNALKSCSDNKVLIQSLTKGNLATVDEIKDALNIIANYRLTFNQAGNYGYLEGRINGALVDNKLWSSGRVLEDEPAIFEAIEASGSTGNSWLRNTDTEFKMLNQLAFDLGGIRGGIYPDKNGVLKIVSENPYCISCQGVIQQFNKMFPNIEIKLIDGVK